MVVLMACFDVIAIATDFQSKYEKSFLVTVCCCQRNNYRSFEGKV